MCRSIAVTLFAVVLNLFVIFWRCDSISFESSGLEILQPLFCLLLDFSGVIGGEGGVTSIRK